MIQQGKVTKALGWTTTAALCGVAGLLLPVAPGLGQPAAPPAQTTAESPAVGIAPAANGATDASSDADTVETRPATATATAAAAGLPPVNVTVDAGGPVGVGAPTAGTASAPPVGIGTAGSSTAYAGADVAAPDTPGPETRAELPAASAPRAEEVDRLRKEIDRLQRRLAELESRGGRTPPARNNARFRGQETVPQTSAAAGPARASAATRRRPAPESGVVYSRAAEGLRNVGSAGSRPAADGDALDDIERDLQQMLERVRAMKGTPSSVGR